MKDISFIAVLAGFLVLLIGLTCFFPCLYFRLRGISDMDIIGLVSGLVYFYAWCVFFPVAIAGLGLSVFTLFKNPKKLLPFMALLLVILGTGMFLFSYIV